MANPTYPHKLNQATTQPNENFGGQAFDGNRVPLGGTESGFVTKDATTSPIISPVSPATGVNTVINIPSNATSVIFVSTVQAAQISEDITFASSLTLPAGVAVQLDIARQSVIYLRALVTGAVVSFAFQVVD